MQSVPITTNVVNSTFQQYFSYIVAVSFIGGGNRSTRHKALTNLNTKCCIMYMGGIRIHNVSGDRHRLQTDSHNITEILLKSGIKHHNTHIIDIFSTLGNYQEFSLWEHRIQDCTIFSLHLFHYFTINKIYSSSNAIKGCVICFINTDICIKLTKMKNFQ
jgi:hypothetical protein